MKNRIRDLRIANNLTQEQLSEKVGVSRQSIVAIERGKYNPSLKLAFKIANEFGLSIEEVFIFQNREGASHE